jgi:hypothetical protein
MVVAHSAIIVIVLIAVRSVFIRIDVRCAQFTELLP